MCLTLFTHHCSVGHETRPLCMLNPATDCTVRSPYVEPARNPCLAPCSGIVVDAASQCAWHGKCCRLVRTPMCGAFDPGDCPNNVAYHQRKEPTTAADNDGDVEMAPPPFPPLPEFNEEPWFVALRWDFFQAGTDLHSVAQRGPHYAAAMARAKSKPSAEAADAAARRQGWFRQARRGYRENDSKYQHIALYLGQLARVWDRNAQYGLCRPRPGRRPDPALAWPGYARVDPDEGVWSIGFELARNVESPVVRPPEGMGVFERHHVPRRVGVNPVDCVALLPPLPGVVLEDGTDDGDSSDLDSILAPETAVCPVSPAPTAASCSTMNPYACSAPSTPLAPPPIPRCIVPETPAAALASQASLERCLALQDADITHQIQMTGFPQQLFARYVEQNHHSHSRDNHNNDMIPDDGLIRQWDPVMRDRVAAARDEVIISPQSSTMVLMPQPGEMETRRVGVGVQIKRRSVEVKMEDISWMTW
ncbi:uncharacterized protein PG986_012504 [Apiospora aurea]|uniref:Uncharacterized protein n=1 Tax=Apiospora aurea TaxID=335848 RepID=A0ABR1Q053_9PEZI